MPIEEVRLKVELPDQRIIESARQLAKTSDDREVRSVAQALMDLVFALENPKVSRIPAR